MDNTPIFNFSEFGSIIHKLIYEKGFVNCEIKLVPEKIILFDIETDVDEPIVDEKFNYFFEMNFQTKYVGKCNYFKLRMDANLIERKVDVSYQINNKLFTQLGMSIHEVSILIHKLDKNKL